MSDTTPVHADMSIVISADDNYSMPLAVAVRSILDHLTEARRLRVFILDGGISSKNKDRCESSWEGNLASVEWIQPDPRKFAKLKSTDHFTIATYYRVLIADLIPEQLNRIIYSDPDVLFLESIDKIHDIDLNGCPIAAAQDVFCPYVDNRVGMQNYELAKPYVYGLSAIPQTDEKIPNPNQPYFNAGFLLVDLEKLRREKLSQQLLNYCVQNRDRLLWADQCAFNACLGDRWVPMDAAWNVTSPVFDLPGHESSCYEQNTFNRIRETPAMLHFAGPQKPWQYGNKHPFVQAYFDVIDRTQWSGWRPMPDSRSEESTRKTGWKEWLLNWHRHKAAKKAA